MRPSENIFSKQCLVATTPRRNHSSPLVAPPTSNNAIAHGSNVYFGNDADAWGQRAAAVGSDNVTGHPPW